MRSKITRLIYHPLFSGSAAMIIGSNGASAINYLFHLIIGRLLGPSLYGELASLISVIGLFGIIPGVVSLVIVKQISSAKNEQEVNNLIKWFKTKLLLAAIIFSIIILILSPFISAFLHINKISYLILIALASLFSVQSGFNRSILQGLLKFKEMVFSILAENGVKLVLSIIFVYVGLQVNGVMLALLLSAFLGLYLSNYFLRYKVANNSNFFPDIKSMLKFTIPVAIQTIALTSIYTTDVILVKHFFPSHDAGIYASLSTLGKIIFFATGPISGVMFPLVSQRKARGQSFKKVFVYSFAVTALFATCIVLLYWFFPALVIRLLYGIAYLEAQNLLIWFGIFISLFTLSSLLINYSLSLGKSKAAILSFIAAISQIILIVLFHQTLFMVIIVSTIVTALLLTSLLIYSIYEQRLSI